MKINTIMKYVVLTNALPRCQSSCAMASANLFFSPNVKPISKNPSHTIIDDMVSHIPYISDET